MSTRISSVVLFAALAACGQAKTDTKLLARVEASQASEAADAGRVQCAPGGAETFARVCEIERAETDRGLVLTVRHPDGGFRRLLVTSDGRGVIAADGAEPAVVTLVGSDEIEVALGDDHYRLPATAKAAPGKAAPGKAAPTTGAAQ